MRPPEPSRVFISYAHRDGCELAQRLQEDLTKNGFDAWLDKQRLRGGASWTKEIETALDKADYILAVLTPGSYVSEICRAEQLRSLRKGKCVIPLVGQSGSDIPLYLETKNYREFSTKSAYGKSFAELLKDIHAGRGVSLKNEFQQTYVTAPPLPVNFVERPEELTALRDALIADDGGRHIALTALKGMGGIGKTVLATALCHNEVVQYAFPDGIIWVSIGRESTSNNLTRMREVCKALGDKLTHYDNELGAKNQYRNTIRSKVALVVVDDVWRVEDLEPLLAESPRSRLLFTTRDAGIAAGVGACEHIAELLTEEQSRNVLARWSGTDRTDLPPMADLLIRECGRLPLALSMVGAMLRGKPEALWKRVLELLRRADLEKISANFPGYPYKNLLAALQVSVDELDAITRERYLSLAVLLEDMTIPAPVQQCLWQVDENEAVETAEKLISLSLAQRDDKAGGIRLHDLQLDYVRIQHPDKKALELIIEAVRRSSDAIAEDPRQFASQIIGRLSYVKNQPTISAFLSSLRKQIAYTWLQPLCTTLGAPSGEFVRTLAGHKSSVTAVAVTTDGQRAVSASEDRTLKVWDLDGGRELRTLAGHRNSVTAVALTSDARRAVSASEDQTLKVWDLARGHELYTLAGHNNSVTAVALTSDGQRAVSASKDHTLKVWDLASGCELHTLTGHSNCVTAVALTSDGQRAVSASKDHTLKVWDLPSGCELRTLTGHKGTVTAVAVTPDGQRAFSASNFGMLKVWDLTSGRELRAFVHQKYRVNAVAVTPDGRRAFSASNHGILKLWDLTSGRELRMLSGHTDNVNAVVVTPDGQRAISASKDMTLKVWNLESQVETRSLKAHSRSVTAVGLSEDGRLAISASDDKTMKVWEVETGRELHTLNSHSSGVDFLAISANGGTVLSLTDYPEHKLKMWDVASGRELHSQANLPDLIFAVAVTPDGRAVFAGSDNKLRMWELVTGRELHTYAGLTDTIFAITVTPDGQRVVLTSGSDTLKIWDLASGRKPRTLIGDARTVRQLAVTPDGQRMVSGSNEGTLKVWDLASGRELRTLEECDAIGPPSGSIRAVAVTPDGQRAVSASDANILKVWDLASGLLLRTLSHRGMVTAMRVTADGKHVVSSSTDNAVKLWELETGKLVATFTCDSEPLCCAVSDVQKVIVAGDDGGHVHFLRLEEPK